MRWTLHVGGTPIRSMTVLPVLLGVGGELVRLETGMARHPKKCSTTPSAAVAPDVAGCRINAPRIRAVAFAAWRAAAAAGRKWRRMELEEPGDEAPRPILRSPAQIHVPQQRRGVSPPPMGEAGWIAMSNGWQRHRRSPNWLRKTNNSGGPVFFYLPDDSLWMTMPNGLFMSVDECSGLIAAGIACFNSQMLRMCFSSWRCQASVTRQWRYKIHLFGGSDADLTTASQALYNSAENARFTSSDACLDASCDD